MFERGGRGPGVVAEGRLILECSGCARAVELGECAAGDTDGGL